MTKLHAQVRTKIYLDMGRSIVARMSSEQFLKLSDAVEQARKKPGSFFRCVETEMDSVALDPSRVIAIVSRKIKERASEQASFTLKELSTVIGMDYQKLTGIIRKENVQLKKLSERKVLYCEKNKEILQQVFVIGEAAWNSLIAQGKREI